MERPGDQEALRKLGRLEDGSKEDGGGWGRGDTEGGRVVLGQEMEASFRLTRGHGPCAVGHSPTLLCASQDVRSGKSEELEKWAADVKGWGNRKRKPRSEETAEGGGRMECRGAGGRK